MHERVFCVPGEILKGVQGGPPFAFVRQVVPWTNISEYFRNPVGARDGTITESTRLLGRIDKAEVAAYRVLAIRPVAYHRCGRRRMKRSDAQPDISSSRTRWLVVANFGACA